MIRTVAFFLILLIFVGCNKSRFLDARPDNKLKVPNTLEDFQSILDNDRYMNGSGSEGAIPVFSEIGSDNYYALQEVLLTFPTSFQNIYIWNDDIYLNADALDWKYAYRAIFYSNVVLDNLRETMKVPNQVETYNNIEGSALFYRAHMLLQLVQIFAPVYDKAHARELWGVPIRNSADVNENITRPSLEDTYGQIISDLQKSITLLPKESLYKTRPSQAAAFALLARTYLYMQIYDSCLANANKCWELRNRLIDYNNLDNSISFPIPQFNEEVLFHGVLIKNGMGSILHPSVSRVDSALYKEFSSDDLRKDLFFGNSEMVYGGEGYYFRGSYDGSQDYFGGIALDEVVLMIAECYGRLNNKEKALQYLNLLMKNRWKSDKFFPFEADNSREALRIILNERRKELLFRGLRWADIRRFNKVNPNILITRTFNGSKYVLEPLSLHYTYLIPPEVIKFNPSMPQNPR